VLGQIEAVRGELRGEMVALRGEVNGRMGIVAAELIGKVDALRAEMKQGFAELLEVHELEQRIERLKAEHPGLVRTP
jgi:hypothetical protein